MNIILSLRCILVFLGLLHWLLSPERSEIHLFHSQLCVSGLTGFTKDYGRLCCQTG